MDAVRSKRVLSATVLAVAFAFSVVLVVVLVLKGRKSGDPLVVSGATLDGQQTMQGSSEGFAKKKACLRMQNKSKRLPIKVRKTKVGPKSVYDKDRCAGGSGGRNSVPGLLRQCVEGLVLRPGEDCLLGVRLVAEGRPEGEVDLSTEMMCTSREIEPCQLLREGMSPTEEKPLALTIDQKTEFPKSDTGFRLTTEQAELTARPTEPVPELRPQPPVTSPGPSPTESPVTPSEPDVTSPRDGESTPVPVDPSEPGETGSPDGEGDPGGPETGQGPAEQGRDQVPPS